ncbi:4-hydroxybenzoate 3-monooxygenase [Actinomycetospora endophytica]|uniref:4-hydroxybenzoate 3-monooxygenase n=1 Tax=Actinomycetospora endophytica TaxID=2291215 RepID=A0ABS8PAE0_9PSEU|nr:4-hydroxybenzoate 3-monooxygenase [Actinomycetospora endophytica]MCD2193959.1 4-hydroxybenzoate 3-monooxygenase [Actinomycetospora endophytica]
MTVPDRTAVAIVGGGPAGLLLSHLLVRQGIDSVVLESRSRERVESRQRAGILEHGTVDVLHEIGADARMNAQGMPHDGFAFHAHGEEIRVDMAALTGRGVMIWAQTEVVRDLIALRLEQGDPLLFDAEVLAVEKVDGPLGHDGEAVVRYAYEGVEHELRADVVVGCDGFHGVARRAIPAEAVRTFERVYPFSWLGILADAPPSSEELVYARHDRGFALLSMRSPSITRAYLQVPNDTDPSSWSHEAIWDELTARTGLADGSFTLGRGPITDVSVTPMRSFVAEPMRSGRLFLAGDAAHIVPPTGAKGLNLAVADVRVLAGALASWRSTGSQELLDAYSDTALRRVWRAEHFSWTMTTMLHRPPDADPFDDRLARSHLQLVASSEAYRTAIAENYRGLDLDGLRPREH